MMKLLSWNVNGIRACADKGLVDFIRSSGADVIGLQETKATPAQVRKEKPQLQEIDGYSVFWNPATRPGYSGTAIYSQVQPTRLETGFGIDEFDREGRTQIAYFENAKKPFIFTNIYYPNGQSGDDRLDYKLRFYDSFLDFAEKKRSEGYHLVMTGDFNTAHRPIDLKNPKENENYSGFLPVERAWIDKFINAGYVDTWRELHPETAEYSWWSYRFNAREKNIGWRIDYFFVDRDFMPAVKDSFILGEVRGSDHCPIGITLDNDW